MHKNKRNSSLQKGLSCLGLIGLFIGWLISLFGALLWGAFLGFSCEGKFPCPHPIIDMQVMIMGAELVVTIGVLWVMVALSKVFWK